MLANSSRIDFVNFWTEELETIAITEIAGLELKTSYEDEENPCFALMDEGGSIFHIFEASVQ